jgi:hypothetical protein
MQFRSTLLLTGLALTGTPVLSHTDVVTTHHKRKCPQFNGSFVIDSYQLYPENADFDFDSCLLYIGFVILSLPPLKE